jgi:glycosyltransferase involved in cell wall biosynthesis
MLAYTQTLAHALALYAPDIDARVLHIGSAASEGNWARRAQTLMLLVRAWKQRGFEPDVWHILDGSRAYIAPMLGPAPAVVTAHDVIPWLQSEGCFHGAPRTGSAAKWLWRCNARQFRAAARLVCVSASTERDVRRCFNVDAARTAVVPLVLRPTLLPFLADAGKSTRKPGQVLHVGNNSFYKARADVLRIYARIGSAQAGSLVMIGPEPTPELSELARSLKIADRLQWISDPDDAQLAGHYHQASVMLFPSRYEGFGWPVLEAMAFGLPVICSNRGSLPEVAGPDGVCIDPDDHPAFAFAASAVLADSAVAECASLRGQRWAETFAERRFAVAMRDVYWAATDRNSTS